MSAPVFLTPAGSIGPVGSSVLLDGAEGRHAANVRRIRVDELIELVDGSGTRASCRVSSVAKDSLTAAVLDVTLEPQPQPRITVVQALAKGDRADLAVELMTEAGVDAIVPWSASRSIAKWDAAKAAKGTERWQSIAREAAKQSRRAYVPPVHALATTDDVGRIIASAAAALVLHEEATRSIGQVELPASGDVVLVVGPEGGISEDEVRAFEVEPVRLGPEVVRTSTAAALATAVLLSGTSRWATR